MTNGFSAMVDRIKQEEENKKLEALSKVNPITLVRQLECINRLLLDFKQSQPALTEHQWSLINNSLQELEELV